MKLFKCKKGSQLVEKVLIVAFSVAAGGAVIVYGTNVINASKNVNVSLEGTVVATNSSGVQLITGHKYKFENPSALQNAIIQTAGKNDYEYFSVSDYQWLSNNELDVSGHHDGRPNSGFVGYSCWDYNESEDRIFLAEPDECCIELCYYIDEAMASQMVFGVPANSVDDSRPRLNDNATYGDLLNKYFVFSGTYARQGNGPCLLDYLIEVED